MSTKFEPDVMEWRVHIKIGDAKNLFSQRLETFSDDPRNFFHIDTLKDRQTLKS
jgi:hypothetical protein